MKKVASSGINFALKKLLAGFEGGAVYTADSGGKFYMIIDESSLASLLDEEDLAGVELTKYLEFETASERAGYISERGWDQNSA